MSQQHSPAKQNNIFSHLAEHAEQIEQQWRTIFHGIWSASTYYPHLDTNYFNTLNDKFNAALQRLHSDLKSPTLILATTGTTSSGKSTIVNLLCGADIMPRMALEMSAGVVYIHHSPDNKKHLKVHETEGALWECGEWHDLTDDEVRKKLTAVMDSFNQNKGINQPATPHIELTYPIACFNNPELLALSNLPKSTQFKLMDLPGLRNSQDSTNATVIKSCRDALCLVAYNMEEVDETKRIELVQQVLEQVKNMGGSPARMLFVLNRIDVFRKDREWQRRQDEHIVKTKTEIKGILHEKLPEHRDILEQLTYSPLSSLPALHAQHIKINNNRLYAADELDGHFNTLIPETLLDDLPRRVSVWSDQDFKRVSDAVWQNSYGADFFMALDQHIQAHFPVLVIPSIVQHFEKEADSVVGEVMRTCYSQLNSSKENYEQACADLIRQNAELRQFLAQSKQILLEPFDQLIEALKKKETDLTILLTIVAEDLAETAVFQGKITADKLKPLGSWGKELRENSIGILQGVKQSLDDKRRNFTNTQADRLSEREQQRLSMACDYYVMAVKTNDESRFEEQLDSFLYQISEVIFNALKNQVRLENSRIHDTVELIMQYYLESLQDGIEKIAPEWNLEIGRYMLNDVKMPEINIARLKAEIEEKSETRWQNKTRTVRKWYTLWCVRHEETYSESYTAYYKCLPDAQAIYDNASNELSQQLDSLVEPFCQMILGYINDLTETVVKEQARVLDDFNAKLNQARQGYQDDYDKVIADWQPLDEQAKQFKQQLAQLTDTRNYL